MATTKSKNIAAKKVTEKKVVKKKELSHLTLVADVGNFNIKLSDGSVLENRFKEVGANDTTIGANTITFDGTTYIHKLGRFDRNSIKPQKNLIMPLLFALGNAGVSGNINLIMHLPSNQMSMKDEVVSMLEGKDFTFTTNIDGVEGTKTVTFDKVGVLKEGFSAFFSMPKRNKGRYLIFDIGGRTTEAFAFIDGVCVKEKTFLIGTMKLFDLIADAETGKGYPREMDEIKGLLDDGILNINDYQSIIDDMFKDLKNQAKAEFPNIDEFEVKLCGGGSEFFEEPFKSQYKKVEVLKDKITANVTGGKEIAKALNF